MKKLIYFMICLLLFLILYILLTSKKNDFILYSWNYEKVIEDKEAFYDLLKEYQINILYQDFSKEYLNQKDDSFIKELKEHHITVYHLAGSPSWGKENGFENIKEEIDKVISFNNKVEHKLAGIVLDIEPYISEKEEKFEKKDFKIYVEQIEKAYQYINGKNIELILAIPYWLDSIDYALLEKLIQNTDGISVMNYNIKKTSKNIENEMKLALKYNKKIDTIYEVKYEDNDYFSSKEDILKDYKKIKEENGMNQLGLSFHHYGSM